MHVRGGLSSLGRGGGWHCKTTLCTAPCHAGGSGALADALDVREQLAAAAASCQAGQTLAPGLDYLIGCEYNPAADQLWLLAGNNAGGVGFFPVAEPRRGSGEQPQSQQQQQQQQQPLFGPPAAVLPGGGHTDVVRSMLWPGAAGSLCVTGGEDSKICVWSMQPHAAAAGPQQQHGGGGGSREQGVARKHHHLHQPGGFAATRRAAPY